LGALDRKLRQQMQFELKELQKRLGVTLVFVTHDQEEALAVADRVAVMKDGTIEQIGTPEELYTTPSSAFVADFVGLSNRVHAEVVDGTVLVHGTPLELLGERLADGPVTAYVRPEDITIEGSRSAGIAAVVVASSFLGSLRRTRLRLADDTLLSVQHDGATRLEPGTEVKLRLKGAPVSAVPRDAPA
jgi:putative spermidine/putrescine transport system ATP-binding protein